jgi:hypothetical protein
LRGWPIRARLVHRCPGSPLRRGARGSLRVLVRSAVVGYFELPRRSGTTVADEEHIRRLQQGAEAWNTWRRDILRRGDLSHADLRGANLNEADLHEAYLRGADLGDAYLGGRKSARRKPARSKPERRISEPRKPGRRKPKRRKPERDKPYGHKPERGKPEWSLADLRRPLARKPERRKPDYGQVRGNRFDGHHSRRRHRLGNLYTSRAEHDRLSNASKIRSTARSVSSRGRLAGQID